jgi:NADPH:quinone reductase-like Zn-dependent oxidoreductase
MKAIVTTGHGGYEQLQYRDVPTPVPGEGEVLLRVLASSVNNTDINTRVGWYGGGGWNSTTPFPLVQGTDCCGVVVAAPSALHNGLIGKRVLVRPCFAKADDINGHIWLGVDFDGAFAQYLKVPASEVFPVECGWTDAELGTIPCAYGTAENMLIRAQVHAGEHVLVTGASGGVGSAAVQLAKARGAQVTALAGTGKAEQVKTLGADCVLERNADLCISPGERSVDVVLDMVAGPAFPPLLKVLKSGGRYVVSGAIGGPCVDLDMRTLYLKDLTLLGSTRWSSKVFPNLIAHIESGAIRALVAQTFMLKDLAQAQQLFLNKQHLGKIAVIPPSQGSG